jgi:hypothetical protein
MEEEIEEKLKEIYKFDIEVNFINFRQYEIKGKIGIVEFTLPILYDSYSTMEVNISSIATKIDNLLPSIFKK